MKSKNTAAAILKSYGIINGIIGVVLGIVIWNSLPHSFAYLSIIEVAVCIVISFLIYAFGETIQLLHDIKLYTCDSQPPKDDSDELPEI